MEIILSDGGSKDSTLDFVSNSIDKVLEHKGSCKQNISRGRNQGALNSLGDVLIFFNADTLISDINNFFIEVLKTFSENNTVAATVSIKVFPEQEILQDRLFHFFYNNYVRLLNKLFLGMGRGECHIIKREYFFKAGGYNEDFYAGEDYDLFKKLRRFGKIRFLKKSVVYESPRRYRKLGYLKVFWAWAKNSIWITIFNKSLSNEWEEIR